MATISQFAFSTNSFQASFTNLSSNVTTSHSVKRDEIFSEFSSKFPFRSLINGIPSEFVWLRVGMSIESDFFFKGFVNFNF